MKGQGIPPEMRIEFALRVQDRRVARHMTQEELGAKVGLARPSVTMIETARCGTSAYRAVLIARALGTTVEDLFGGETGGDVREPYLDYDRAAVVTPAEGGDHDAWVVYTNWRGETERRHIRPHAIWYGASSWHPGRQWLLGAWDLERQAHRTFALAGIRAWAATADGLPAVAEAATDAR